MNKHPHNTPNPVVRCAAIVFVTIVSFISFGHDLRAQTPTPSPIPWPTASPFKPAINAFTKVLTQAGWDKNLRNELTLSCDSAKKAVARLANMKIPDDVIIIFYKGEVIAAPSPTVGPTAALKIFGDPRQNERVHVFVLPPFNENDKTTMYEYKDYLMCCYQYWRS
jgi:hypothetical protein